MGGSIIVLLLLLPFFCKCGRFFAVRLPYGLVCIWLFVCVLEGSKLQRLLFLIPASSCHCHALQVVTAVFYVFHLFWHLHDVLKKLQNIHKMSTLSRGCWIPWEEQPSPNKKPEVALLKYVGENYHSAYQETSERAPIICPLWNEQWSSKMCPSLPGPLTWWTAGTFFLHSWAPVYTQLPAQTEWSLRGVLTIFFSNETRCLQLYRSEHVWSHLISNEARRD